MTTPEGNGPVPPSREVPLTPDRAESWHRVHPVSPFVRGWIALAAIAYFFGRDWFEAMFRGEPLWFLTEGRGIWAVVVLLVVVLLLVGAFVLSWWFTRYQVTEEHVRVNSGVVFRQHRQARLDLAVAQNLGQPSRVVGCPVDPETRRQLLQRLGHLAISHRQIAVGVLRGDVLVDAHALLLRDQ